MRRGANNGWLSITEAACKYRVHPATVRRWAISGKVAAVKPGGHHWRVKECDLEHPYRSQRNDVAARSATVLLDGERGRMQIEMLRHLAAMRPPEGQSALTAMRAAGIKIPAEATLLLERELGMVPCVNNHDVPAYLKFCSECGVRMAA